MAESTSSFEWVPSSNGRVPQRAIPGGYTGSGEALYIGRVVSKGEMICGKVQPSHRVLYVPLDGKERSFNSSYEVLIATN